jgi:hypothetical protein
MITALDILNWHGSDHTIEELAEYMADILNRKVSVKEAIQDVESSK